MCNCQHKIFLHLLVEGLSCFRVSCSGRSSITQYCHFVRRSLFCSDRCHSIWSSSSSEEGIYVCTTIWQAPMLAVTSCHTASHLSTGSVPQPTTHASTTILSHSHYCYRNKPQDKIGHNPLTPNSHKNGIVKRDHQKGIY